jgi:putative ABC transport system permease protein
MDAAGTRAARAPWWRLPFEAPARLLAARNLRSDRFGTLAAVLGVALGAATVSVVVVLDTNTTRIEAERASASASTRAAPAAAPPTVAITAVRRDGAPALPVGAGGAPREDFEVLRAGIRFGSLAAFLVGALIVFFTFGAVVDRRRREVALLRSLGALPAQVAAIFVREAGLIGLSGGALGLAASIPLAYLAAAAGITTTGHLKIAPAEMSFPWAWMALVSLAGAAISLLGVLRPARLVARLEVAAALRPRFLEGEGGSPVARRARSVMLAALPITSLAYAAARPLVRRAVPALAFHGLEAAGVCVFFLAALVLVPDLVQRLGGLLVRLLPGGAGVERLITRRRIEQLGHELAWSVSGVMLVSALLLTLHLVTHGLKREVVVWAGEALHDETFVLPWYPGLRADTLTAQLPKGARVLHLSGRTPWPNALHAARAAEVAALAEDSGRPDLAALARRLGPGKIVLSTLMARRFHVGEGDALDVSGEGGARRLEIVAVTDGLGFTPMNAPHRHARTYGLIDAADEALIAPYAASIGAVAVVAHGSRPEVTAWRGSDPATLTQRRGIYLFPALFYEHLRLREANSDFLVFDLMLALTSVLAGVGIASHLLLSVRARRREIALYRVLGMTTGQVRRLVLLEGAFIGLLGGCLAALLGVLLGVAALGALRAVSGLDVRFDLPPSYVLLTVLGAVGIATVASLHPASRAARASAAESVHHE